MQYIMRFNPLPKKAGAFREWLQKNAAGIGENQAEGWKYLGTWFTVRGFGKFTCETRWELTDYAALGADDPGNETAEKLNQEWYDFVDLAGAFEVCLMKSDADILIAPGL